MSKLWLAVVLGIVLGAALSASATFSTSPSYSTESLRMPLTPVVAQAGLAAQSRVVPQIELVGLALAVGAIAAVLFFQVAKRRV